MQDKGAAEMDVELVIAGLIALVLLAYLAYSLIYPERF
ncbi:MAG: potassium-transporting ATPase subunit F [Anaerolineae bacterium]|nr:potassium-transporting ATPase subunit F [Anaerolineae bacterium]